LGSQVLLKSFAQQVLSISKELDPYPTKDSFRDWADPEGYAKNRGLAGPSEMEVLNELGIFPLNGPRKLPVKPTVRLMRRNLQLFVDRNGDTRPGTLLDPSCEYLIRAFNGAYASKDDNSEKFSGGITTHVVDAFRYAQAGEFGLGKVKAA